MKHQTKVKRCFYDQVFIVNCDFSDLNKELTLFVLCWDNSTTTCTDTRKL